MSFILRQVREIQNQRLLSVYGGLLCLGYLYFWIYLFQYGFDFKLSYLEEPICWPFFNSCDVVRIFSPSNWQLIFAILAFLSLLNAVLFFKRKVHSAYVLTLLLESIRIAIILYDYRVRLNQNYMFTFIIVSFLFVGNKRETIPRLLVLFYFWAGFLKLNNDWLSGSSIYGNLFLIPASLKSLSAKYVVVLERLLTPFLLFPNRFIKYGILFQLFLFHVVSLSVVGFFYPALMVTLLSFFILMDYFPIENRKDEPAIDRLGSFGFLLLFSILNFYPYFIPGDKTLTGETRLISLHMFDSVTYCNPWAVLKYKNKAAEKKNLFMPNVVRIRCDPIVFLSRLRKICKEEAQDPNFMDVDFTLDTRKGNSKTTIRVIDAANFCSKHYSYSIWGRNEWIKTE